jgi:hypothetical protein
VAVFPSNPPASKFDFLNFVSMTNTTQEIHLSRQKACCWKKTPRDKLSQAQYFQAALEMYPMFEAEDVGNDYRLHITRVAQLAQVFTWASVLLFDREFCKLQLQAEKTTPEWADESSYLMSL